MNEWLGAARTALLRLRDRTGAWGYRTDRGPTSEATALCCLGLWSCRGLPPRGADSAAIGGGSDWLQKLQQADGSLGVSPALPRPGWTTPYALLLWNTLDVYPTARRRACAWLLEQTGARGDKDQVLARAVVGDDQSLVGWPWTAGTNSWPEPTAISIVALDREGLGNIPGWTRERR